MATRRRFTPEFKAEANSLVTSKAPTPMRQRINLATLRGQITARCFWMKLLTSHSTYK